MARKKSEVTEEIQNVEPTIEETPVEEVVETKPKRGRKKKTAEVIEEPASVEEIPESEEIVPVVTEVTPVVDEVPAEELIVVEEVKPEPIKEKKTKKVETPKVEVAPEPTPTPTTSGMVITKSQVYVLRLPGKLDTKIGNYPMGTKFEIIEKYKGWGKIAEGKWVNLNYVEKL